MPRKTLWLGLALLAFGALRMPFEDRLTAELRQQRLLPGKLEISTRDRIEQTGWAVALGGLRTVVATILNLRAYGFFSTQRWDDLGDTYDMIVDLAPHTRYYWEAGSWHLAYNAASYYLHDSTLPGFRRREIWRDYVAQGREFLDRAIRNNPEDWRLRHALGSLLLDPNKFNALRDPQKAFVDAADAYGAAVVGEGVPEMVNRFHVYALARVPGREAEALERARLLHARNPRNRTPTMLALLYVLENHAAPDLDAEALAIRLFGNPQKAYEVLSRHWTRTRECYPMDGVARGLALLEARLQVPDQQSVLRRPPPPPPQADDWFRDP